MNDPRITSYALGELSGRDRAQFERELAASDELQRELIAASHLTEILSRHSIGTDTLTAEERTSLRRDCQANLTATRRRSKIVRSVVAWGALAAAACFLFSLAIPAISVNKRKALAGGAGSRHVPSAPSAMPSQAAYQKTQPLSPSVGAGNKIADAIAAGRNSFSTGKEITTFELRQAISPIAQFDFKPENQLLVTVPQVAGQMGAGGFGGGGIGCAGGLGGGVGKGSGRGFATVNGASGSGRLAQAGAGKITFFGLSAGSGRGSGGPVSGFYANSPGFNTESYDHIRENVFLPVKENPLSTFSIDVDTASYANVRRFLQNDQMPPAGAIRTEELINYFPYSYPQPDGDSPFSVNLEINRTPWDSSRQLLRIALKGREIPAAERKPSNLVFLIDVSGSMEEPNKLPLLQRSLAALVKNLSPQDRVAIVTYAGASGMALPSTAGTKKLQILEALAGLQAGGSTNGASGIALAYRIARENFLGEGNNRVILCTDGDFNVGTTSTSELVRLIEKERASGVFLSVLGFGTGNLKDSTMKNLADKGNGNYAYIDSFAEGRKVLVDQMGGTLYTIAKDVKIQVEFNPAHVAGYRLVGYESRLLAKEDFNNDRKDAGDMGAGHSVTAFYEVIPAGRSVPDGPNVDRLKYQENPPADDAVTERKKVSAELLTVKIRYKTPEGNKSRLIETPFAPTEIPAFNKASPEFQFAAAVAAFGMKLRGTPDAGEISWTDINKIARSSLGEDPGSVRAEFLTLVEKASRLNTQGRTDP